MASLVVAAEIRGEEKAQGMRAKEWVSKTLAQSDRITIQSLKLDSFGRAIAEVWYWNSDRWLNLNDELLSLGLAQKYVKK